MLSRWMPRPSKPLKHRNGLGGFDSHTFPPIREETPHFAGFFLHQFPHNAHNAHFFLAYNILKILDLCHL